MRSAKDIALKILQNTVYTMVNDIRTCSQEIISGLKNRIGNLEKQQEPLEILVIELYINDVNNPMIVYDPLPFISVFGGNFNIIFVITK